MMSNLVARLNENQTSSALAGHRKEIRETKIQKVKQIIEFVNFEQNGFSSASDTHPDNKTDTHQL